MPCDGEDDDSCPNGVWQCSQNKLGVECIEEPSTNKIEECNGADDDCDGLTDENLASCCTEGETKECGTDIGICTTGQQTCQNNGQWGDCNGIQPENIELCDLLDNDCDGDTDEDFPKVANGNQLSCDSADNDECEYGFYRCKEDKSGVECYESSDVINAVEVCNGADDDCDGAIDEDYPEVANGTDTSCDGTDADSCPNGFYRCNSEHTGIECNEDISTNQVETCDAIDNDCDGDTDEDVPDCCTENDTKPCGSNEGICTQGIQTCINREWGNCTGTLPVAEICDGLDNDCDAGTDEDFALVANGTQTECDGTDTDHCTNGYWQCKQDGTGVECNENSDLNKTETCNGKDDDCDNSVDEDFTEVTDQTVTACDGEDADLCKNGYYECKSDETGVKCNEDPTLNIVDICNGIDDDCDGITDEDYVEVTNGKQTACDDLDADKCKNGVYKCKPDGSGVFCYEDDSLNKIEICNGVDDDCDQIADGSENLTRSCGSSEAGICSFGIEVCNDSGNWINCNAVLPQTETCNNKDNDCDGNTDEGFDVDKDGYSSCNGDCNDNSEFVYPGAVEVCDKIDNNCTSGIDENLSCKAIHSITDSRAVYDIAAYDNEVWLATKGGAVLLDKTSCNRVAKYTPTDGLANSEVNAISISTSGKKWFGTYGGGLSSFDGTEWKTFNSTSGINTFIKSIIVDKNSKLWVGTWTAGIYTSSDNGNTWTRYSTSEGLASNSVYNMVVDDGGYLWAATRGGLAKFDGSSWSKYTTEDGLPSDTVYTVGLGPNGAIWAGTGQGAVRILNGNVQVFTTADGLNNNNIKSIVRDTADTSIVWIATSNGLNSYKNDVWTNYSSSNTQGTLSYGAVNGIATSADGTRWFATSSGAVKYDGQNWKSCSYSEDLKSNHIFDIAIDTDGSKWFGSYAGASNYDGTNWKYYTQADGLKGSTVYSIFVDPNGIKWFGTSGGVNRFDGTTITAYTTAEGLAHNTVRAITQDSDGSMWFGTSGGVSHFKDGSWTNYTKSNSGLAGDNVKTILIDNNGNKWFGTVGDGASKFDGQNWTSYNTAEGLDDKINKIIMDNSNKLWFATQCAHLRVYNSWNSTFTTYQASSSTYTGSCVYDAYLAPNGVKWFSTEGSFASYDDTNWNVYTTEQGLTNHKVSAIAVDNNGVVWLGTEVSGISYFTP